MIERACLSVVIKNQKLVIPVYDKEIEYTDYVKDWYTSGISYNS